MGIKIEINNGSSFCFDITTAIWKAEELERSQALYCLCDIMHNGIDEVRTTATHNNHNK